MKIKATIGTKELYISRREIPNQYASYYPDKIGNAFEFEDKESAKVIVRMLKSIPDYNNNIIYEVIE